MYQWKVPRDNLPRLPEIKKKYKNDPTTLWQAYGIQDGKA